MPRNLNITPKLRVNPLFIPISRIATEISTNHCGVDSFLANKGLLIGQCFSILTPLL